MFYKGRVVKDTGGQFRSNFQRVNISGLGGYTSSTREYSVWRPRPGRLSTHSQIYILEKSFTRMNLLMLLMQGMMTKFMHTNIFGEPNDYTLEKFGKAEGKNGDDWS
jgi:hypothetical protein